MRNCFFFLAFMAFVTLSAGVLVGPVHLAHNRRYISFQLGPSPENSTLECPVTLEDADEEVKKISWVLWKDGVQDGSYEWFSNGDTATATGILADKVNLLAEKGALEFTVLTYDLSANYSCSVTLTSGVTAEAEKWELLVIDTTSNYVRSSGHDSRITCEYVDTFEPYAVFPKPTVRSGMYSATMGGYYDEVAAGEWRTRAHPNGSVQYYYVDHAFKIDQYTPPDAELISTIGVTKSDGTAIILATIKSSNILWKQKGCPEIILNANQEEESWSGGHTCRMEHTPGTLFVVCEEGYHADGEVENLEFTCKQGPNESFSWVPDLTNLGNLKCVINGGGRVSASLLSLCLLLLSLLLPCLLQ